MTEFHPAAAIFPLLKGAPFDALVADIKANGLLQPITLTGEPATILDGRNRYLACAEAGVPCDFDLYEGDDPVGFVISLNAARRHLDESQRAICAARALMSNLTSNWSDTEKLFNISHGSLVHAKHVLEKGIEELVDKIDIGDVAVSRAAEISELDPVTIKRLVMLDRKTLNTAHDGIKRDHARQRVFARMDAPPDLPTGKWSVFLADPPWEDEFGISGRSVENHYLPMTLEDIKALDIAAMATDDAILFLWALPHMLQQALDVCTAWGFQYRTHMVWLKGKLGLGQWVRNEHELLFIARRGAFPTPEPYQRGRPGADRFWLQPEHGYKPWGVHAQLIETWYPATDASSSYSAAAIRARAGTHGAIRSRRQAE